DRVLDRDGQLALDLDRRRTRQLGGDDQLVEGHGREALALAVARGPDAEHHDRGDHHVDQEVTANEVIDDGAHGYSTSTAAPSRSANMPSVTTRSPGASPASTATRSAPARP